MHRYPSQGSRAATNVTWHSGVKKKKQIKEVVVPDPFPPTRRIDDSWSAREDNDAVEGARDWLEPMLKMRGAARPPTVAAPPPDPTPVPEPIYASVPAPAPVITVLKREKQVYDPSVLSTRTPEEAEAMRSWILGTPRVFLASSDVWEPTQRQSLLRVGLVRQAVPREDAADVPYLAQQDALAAAMALSVMGDE
jgi:hypothetical protein